VASAEPTRTSPKPAIIAGVRCSSRITTPSTAATAGFTYVITVARTGPTSAISAKKQTNAIAVHTTASPTTEPIAFADGVSVGRVKAAIGTYATAVTAREAAMTPMAGSPESQRCRIAGPTA
jgi:hypothetical protein